MAEDRENIGTANTAEAFGIERLAGRYQILGLLGVGGMGSVYRARDFELDEVVALKMLRAELVGSEAMLGRFRQEVKLARRVTHRNVARTFDIGEHGGEKFLTMEYVEGESLASSIARRGPLPIGEAVFIASEICAGLGAAHAAGVVHRDLKPDNVLMGSDGRVVITDFGIARGVDPDARSAATVGALTGTPAYMAPEQVEGGAIDARADLYALGEILYEMLTGTMAWTGESLVQVAAARLHRPPPNPRAVRADLPDALVAVVARAMARRPEERFVDATEILRALSALTLPAANAELTSLPGVIVNASAPAGALEVPPPAAAAAAARANPSPTKSFDKTIAVLIFRNAGPADDAYLGEGLTEDLIDALSVVRGVRVRAFGAVQPFRDKPEDPRTIGERLDVQVVVDGSVRRVGEALRVSARVVSVSDGFQLWARRYDKPIGAFMEIGDEIANAIADALTVEHQPAHRQAPTDPAAIELYLRGRHELKFAYRAGTQRAIGLFSEALKRAPHDPIILCGYAMAQLRELMFGDNETATESVARGIVEDAVKIAPDLPEPHLALAALERSVGEFESAARSLNRALSLGRPSADALDLLGAMVFESGPLEQAVRNWELALALEPRLYQTRAELARAHELLGNAKRREELLNDVPDEAYSANGYWTSRVHGIMWRGDIAEAKALLERTGERAVPAPADLMLHVYVTKNVPAGALREIDQRITPSGNGQRRAKRRAEFFGKIKVEFMAHLGEHGAALETLAAIDGAGSFDTTWFERCPLLDPLRGDARFQDYRRRAAERAARLRAALGV